MTPLARHSLLVLAGGAALFLAGCGGGDGEGSGNETFDEPEFTLTFEYPSTFEKIDDVSIASTAGAASKATSARGLDDKNLLLVSRYNLNIEVDEDNLKDVKDELDTVVSQAAKQEVEGEETQVGGLPGYEYEFDLNTTPPVHSRFVVVFDDKTEYTLNCQSTTEHRDEVDTACALALDTLRVE
jgi:hypothetical protein